MRFLRNKPAVASAFGSMNIAARSFHGRWVWSFVLSALIHFLILWQFPYISPYAARPLSSSHIIVTQLTPESGAFSSTGSLASKTASAPRVRTLTRERPDGSSQSNQPASPTSDSSAAAGGESAGEGLPRLENAFDEGRGVGGIGPPAGGGGTASGGTGNGTGTAGGTAKGKSGSPNGNAGLSAAERYAIAIPPAIQRTTSPYESEVYPEIDFYTLFTPDLRGSVNVPANQVCLDGDIIRTHERQILSHTVTDISKCRYEDYSDKDEMRCPKEAHTRW